MHEDGMQTFLQSLRRQEAAEQTEKEAENSAQKACETVVKHDGSVKLNVTEAATRFVKITPSAIDEVDMDLGNPGLFDDIFYEELIIADEHRAKKAAAAKADSVAPDNLDDLNTVDKQNFGSVVGTDVPTTVYKELSSISPDLEDVSAGKLYGINALYTTKTSVFKICENPETEQESDLNVIDQDYFGELGRKNTLGNDCKGALVGSLQSEDTDKNQLIGTRAINKKYFRDRGKPNISTKVEENTDKQSDLSAVEAEYFDEGLKSSTSDASHTCKSPCFENVGTSKSDEVNVIDTQYFGDFNTQTSGNNLKPLSTDIDVYLENSAFLKKESNVVTARGKPKNIAPDTVPKVVAHKNDQLDRSIEENDELQLNMHNNKNAADYTISATCVESPSASDTILPLSEDLTRHSTVHSNNQDEGSAINTAKDSLHSSKVDVPRKKSAYGLNLMKAFIPDLNEEPSYHVVDLLVNSIIFQDEKVVCIDKPYGLHSQGGPGVYHSISKYLPQIAEAIKFDGTLHLCQRMDKDTTGALLLAKGEEALLRIRKRMEQGEIERRYLAITFGVPRPLSGIIDIPIAAETLVKGNYRSILVPHDTKTRRKGVYAAVTEYEVQKHSLTAALVELRITAGCKDQVRVHLADGLGTPILGDHKYSHRNKMAPQRLTNDILTRFKLAQSQVRNIPLHLHAKKLVLPNYFSSGKELVLGVKIPYFFSKAIRTIKFRR